MTWPFPWPEPRSVYDNNGPNEPTTFDYGGKSFCVSPTSEVGIDSGRRRFRVECLRCGVVVHEATTSGPSAIRRHAEDACKESDMAKKTKEPPGADEEASENYSYKLGQVVGIEGCAGRLREKAKESFGGGRDEEARMLRALADQFAQLAHTDRVVADAYARKNGLKE